MSLILVTGGSSGIGEALVRRLSGSGHDVVLTYASNQAGAEQLAAETGATAHHYDQRDPARVAALAGLLRDGRFDGLVNNAAAGPGRGAALKVDPAAVVDSIGSAVGSTLALCQAFAASCKARGAAGSIVNVLSSVVLGPPPAKQLGYVTTKYALLGLTRALAAEFAEFSVRVNAVSPGMTRTKMVGNLPERFVEMYEAGLPLGRIARPDEVAAAIAFLLSAEASYMTAANLPVTGGAQC